MWITALLLLPLLEGNFASVVDCTLDPVEKCVEADFRLAFPESEEEVVETCRVLMSNTKCMLDFTETCGGEENEILKMRRFLSYLQKSCQVNSPVYQGVVNSLPCIKPIFATEDGECKKNDDQKAMKFFMYLMDLSARGIKDVTENGDKKKECLDALYFNACSAAEVGTKCGTEARNTVVDILRNFDNNLKKCNPKIVEDMMNLVYLFETTDDEN